MISRLGYALVAGWVGGFAGNALLGALFSSPLIRGALYDPAWQSPLFIEVTLQRNIAISVIGLIVLSGLHGLLFEQLWPSIPGRTWLKRGLFFGTAIWSIYWLFQEWFIYVTLFKEPLLLAFLELAILLCGSLVEGTVIAWLLIGRTQRSLAKERYGKP